MMFKLRTYFILGALFFCWSVKAQVPGAAIDVLHYAFTLHLNDANNQVKGKAEISLKFLKHAPAFQINLVKKNRTGNGMVVSSVTENGHPIRFVQDSDAVNIYSTGALNSHHTYTIVYEGIPADGLIISTNKFNHRTFFGDNWPNRAHNWLPCADDPADKASVDFIVTAPDHYQVVANGLKVSETTLANRLKLTHWKETAQLSTKIMVIGVADFAVDHPATVNGIPVYSYVFPENSAVGFKSYAVAKEILPFFINKIGPYAYKKLANVQSKTIFGGMENAGAIFYFENSVISKSIEELMAHEIAHQWFGDAVSEKSFYHLWLGEGFATYLTNYYLESKYGPDTLKKRLITDRIKILKYEKEERVAPVVDASVKRNYMLLLNANSYEKGSWVLHMLRRKLGDAAFWKGIRAYYATYNGGNANTDDFRHMMENASGKNLHGFFNQWLYTAGHPELDIDWKYDDVKHLVTIQVKQKQKSLYHLPLEISVDGKLHVINLTSKETSVNLSAEKTPDRVVADPNVNLFASFTVTSGQ